MTQSVPTVWGLVTKTSLPPWQQSLWSPAAGAGWYQMKEGCSGSEENAVEWPRSRLALEIYSIRHQKLLSLLLSGHLPICFLHTVELFCSFSFILIPVILFEPICLILHTVHLFDRYPIDSSVNNGGSSSFRQLLINSLQRRAQALLNTKAHTHTDMHTQAPAE